MHIYKYNTVHADLHVIYMSMSMTMTCPCPCPVQCRIGISISSGIPWYSAEFREILRTQFRENQQTSAIGKTNS